MNILDLLIEDHDKLRRAIARLHCCLTQPDLKNRIKDFISTYELHESVEDDILFPGVEESLKNAAYDRLVGNYETEHDKIWTLLDQLMDSLMSSTFEELQKSFFKFAAVVESHLFHEERVLFPTVRDAVDEKILKELGKKAAERFSRFAQAV